MNFKERILLNAKKKDAEVLGALVTRSIYVAYKMGVVNGYIYCTFEDYLKEYNEFLKASQLDIDKDISNN